MAENFKPNAALEQDGTALTAGQPAAALTGLEQKIQRAVEAIVVLRQERDQAKREYQKALSAQSEAQATLGRVQLELAGSRKEATEAGDALAGFKAEAERAGDRKSVV